MKAIYQLFFLLFVGVMLSGCGAIGGTGFLQDNSQVNQLIAQSDENMLKALAEGLVACGENEGCKIALSSAYFSQIGQRKFFKPESVSDILMAGSRYIPLVDEAIRLWANSSYGAGSNGGLVLVGDNNQVSNLGNRTTADNQSSLTGTFDTSSSIEHLVYTQDSTQSSSNGEGSVGM
jgi:hypothetical protein